MAEIEILLQGLRPNNDHESAVKRLLTKPSIDSFLLSLAFVRSNGVAAIEKELRIVANRVVLYMGIRNGITSIQGVFALLKIGIHPFVVDTASNSKIFHPKIYAAINQDIAHVILGSANLTFSGLNRNIEASSYMQLDRANPGDNDFINNLSQTIQDMPATYPQHVFKISSPRQAYALYKEGKLEDERITKLPVTQQKPPASRNNNNLPPMPTLTHGTPKPSRGAKKKALSSSSSSRAILVWESKPLTERSLNIPSGTNTHITGGHQPWRRFDDE